MSNKSFLYLVIVSILVLSGCFISGKVVDENGAGIAGITVILSGGQSRTTTTDSDGKYRFGDLFKDDMIPTGSYTITPSGNFTPASRDVTITTQTLGDLVDIPGPRINVGFEVLDLSLFCEDQINDVQRGSSIGCGTPGSLFQSFTPNVSPLQAVDLKFRAGGSFPEAGYVTTINIRENTPDGSLLGTATASISGSRITGEQINVRFNFTPEIALTPGATYVIEWIEVDSDAWLTWMQAQNDTYPGGTAFSCGGGFPVPEKDQIFITYTSCNNCELLFDTRIDYDVGEWPTSVATGDLDGDGDMDLAVANTESDDLSVLLGNGDGSFRSAVNYGTGDGPRSVAIGDLDGDGDMDLVVGNSDDNNVSVLLGNGGGSFQSAVNYEAGGSPSSVATGDLDGDGDMDLAVANWLGDDVVLLGNGDGSFQDSVSSGAGNGHESVAIGELNGDGALDLAVANFFDDNVSVLLGNGDGSFKSAINYEAGGSPSTVAIGDLDGDGALDLAVANHSDDNVSVLLGNGDGSFQSAVNYDTGDTPESVSIGDLDGDGALDLAVANFFDDNVSVLLGNGDGSFQDAVNYETGDTPESVAIGDLDGDGDMDLAVVNVFRGNVSVLINLCQSPVKSDP